MCCFQCFSEVKENGVNGEDAVRDPNIFRETREKEEVYILTVHQVNTNINRIQKKKQHVSILALKQKLIADGQLFLNLEK